MIVLLTSLLTFVLATLYFTHRSLRSTLHAHHERLLPPSTPTRITSLPADLTAHPENYSIFYDQASRPVPRRLLPDIPLPELLTALLRRNMAAFSHFPQAWLLRLNCPTERGSFCSSYLQKLEFAQGECVCGIYRVAARKEDRVELEMSRGNAVGRLVIGYVVDKRRETVTFLNETVMWCSKDEGTGKLPLENRVVRFFHEMTAWWLMDSGVCYLMDMDGSEGDERVAFGKNGE
ncbi:uncharacterized protein ASPGLDRAFT_50244 [Aspergillus glaucus CBS 516.65]|uniref:Uncharacterized protein n=1 Tax=Aspergillus glaucus CBS 516.65 TaxID=1160497 RepID=A0A1L9VCT9_ASPGL|nr:hypothetical protein ASPGLDRAFT_50244 [Aspergillus glaucus CBS 516.65]OJJ81695.1 hypothetical protein ASPGLDRAFT_50244 [Aspergillus glaucus CBS 516.65]